MSELATSRNTNELQTAYSYWLSQLTYLSPRSALKFKIDFPTFESWEHVPKTERHDAAKKTLGVDSSKIFTSNFDAMIERALNELQTHRNYEIQVVPIDSSDYPYLLKQIPDPPLVLFVRGSIEVLTANKNAAVIGTRDATPKGKTVATRIAKWLGQNDWCIVSGLATGIDTAAHLGALEARAPTVAVMATALDTVYPAENRPLAKDILNAGGCWISETPLKRKPHRGSFVQRDRIQSGLSVAVIPVQTDVEGGTMHTVRFTQQQKRLLLCPRPIETEQSLKQYAGIKYLIESKRATPFSLEQYDQTLECMISYRNSLLHDWTPEPGNRSRPVHFRVLVDDTDKVPDESEPDRTKPRKTKRKSAAALQEGFDFISDFDLWKKGKTKQKPKKQLENEIEIIEQLIFDLEQARHPDGRSLSSADEIKEWLESRIKALKQAALAK